VRREEPQGQRQHGTDERADPGDLDGLHHRLQGLTGVVPRGRQEHVPEQDAEARWQLREPVELETEPGERPQEHDRDHEHRDIALAS
jgi:hypothetical protein